MSERQQGEEGVNVQVLLRCRPLSDKEQAERTPQVITCNEALREVTLFQNNGGKSSSKTFRFDKVFGCDSTQEKLFKQAIVPIVHEVMDGFNCTIFAYGQTGTGKTYTMEGGPRESDDGRKLSAQAGVIPRSIKQIFDQIEASNTDSTVKVSFLELYNEELTDLMSVDDVDSKKLRLLEDKSGVVVQGLEEVIVRSATEIYQVLDRGTAKRKTAATLLNQRSSRSHSIFTITIHMKETTNEGEDVIKIGKLNLVDLAGSENISRSGAKDGRAREAGSINQSLLTLGRVITALVEHSGHVPYRDSKLTRLLRDSLGGRTKTCIIATIAPTGQCVDETISTLDYAHRAKNIRNRPELNQKISKTTMIKELAAEIEKLKLDLCCTREKNGVYLSSERYEQNEIERAQLRESVKALRSEIEANEATQVAAMEALQAQHTAQLSQVQAQLQSRTAQLTATKDELDATTISLQERVFVTASLRRAEQSLAAFAEKLTQELGLCAQDMHLLTQHLDQVSGLQGSDRQCLQQLQNLVSGRVQDLLESLSGALSSQSQHLTAIKQDVASFTKQKQQDIAALRTKLNSIQSGVDDLHRTAQQQLQATSRAASDCYQSVEEQAMTYQQEATAAATAATTAADGALTALLRALQGQAQSLEAMARTHADEAAEAERHIQLLTGAAKTGLTGAATAAQEAAKAQESGLARVQGIMKEFSTSFEVTLQQQQTELVSRVAELLQTFATNRSGALAVGLRGINEAITGNSTASTKQANEIASSAGQTLTQVQDLSVALSQHVSGSLASLQASAGSSHAAVTAAGTAGVAAQQQLMYQLQGGVLRIATHAQAVADTVAGGRSQGAELREQSEQALAGSTQTLLRLQGDVTEAVQSQHDEAMVFAGAVSRQAADAIQALADASGGLQQDVSQMVSDVETTVSGALSFAVPAGPTQRSRPEPPTLSTIQDLMCPPEDVVLAQLRNTKREIIKRGGDVRQAGALLLSPAHMMASLHTAQAPSSPPPYSDLGGAMPGTPTSQLTQGQPTGQRSRIPGAPAGKLDATTPAKSSLAQRTGAGLTDRTNL